MASIWPFELKFSVQDTETQLVHNSHILFLFFELLVFIGYSYVPYSMRDIWVMFHWSEFPNSSLCRKPLSFPIMAIQFYFY